MKNKTNRTPMSTDPKVRARQEKIESNQETIKALKDRKKDCEEKGKLGEVAEPIIDTEIERLQRDNTENFFGAIGDILNR